MAQKYRIKRIVNITAPHGGESVFFEVWDIFNVDGEEREHRNFDHAFKTEAEAQAWIEEQDDK
ncbi:hypothetical protein [Thalassobius sp. I31.1]|uniref:hypothetical protein n=1 Tax=Thalassobius sp. I31.1 TaxID=2109912 RepID=UPI000D1BDE4C|nr:hypothetical protein [Thalassobius sp. I31.1]